MAFWPSTLKPLWFRTTCFGEPLSLDWDRRIYARMYFACRCLKRNKTFNKGSLGSRIDEERSEARNVV
jgi:hypothetical protein